MPTGLSFCSTSGRRKRRRWRRKSTAGARPSGAWRGAACSSGPGAARRTADELGRGLLLPEVLAHLPRKTRALTLVPDDSLHGFPFAALVHEGRHLVESFALSVAFDRRPPAKPSAARAARASRNGA